MKLFIVSIIALTLFQSCACAKLTPQEIEEKREQRNERLMNKFSLGRI